MDLGGGSEAPPRPMEYTMKTQEELIEYYEKMLEKVKAAYSGDCRKGEYIKYAEDNLEAVKNGREW